MDPSDGSAIENSGRANMARRRRLQSHTDVYCHTPFRSKTWARHRLGDLLRHQRRKLGRVKIADCLPTSRNLPARRLYWPDDRRWAPWSSSWRPPPHYVNRTPQF
jgi:hypothetical protein